MSTAESQLSESAAEPSESAAAISAAEVAADRACFCARFALVGCMVSSVDFETCRVLLLDGFLGVSEVDCESRNLEKSPKVS
jgi:hypothetical protein